MAKHSLGPCPSFLPAPPPPNVVYFLNDKHLVAMATGFI